jgi:hypothetical protein
MDDFSMRIAICHLADAHGCLFSDGHAYTPSRFGWLGFDRSLEPASPREDCCNQVSSAIDALGDNAGPARNVPDMDPHGPNR